MARRCPPHCGYNCQLAHHPLLIALLNTVPRDNNPISFTALEATISRYQKIGFWHKDKEIPDPFKDFQFPLLLWAATLGMPEVVFWLKQHNFSQHSRHPHTGEGALHLAIKSFLEKTIINQNDPLEDFKKLVNCLPGALTVRDKEGNSPLHICAFEIAHADSKKKLMRDFAEAMLEFASEKNDAIIATMLNSQNNDGNTVLHLLSKHDRGFRLAKYIIGLNRTDLNLKNNKKETAFDVAVSNGALQISSLLSTCLMNVEEEAMFEDDYEPVTKLRRLQAVEPSPRIDKKTSPKENHDTDGNKGKPVDKSEFGGKTPFLLKDDLLEITKSGKESIFNDSAVIDPSVSATFISQCKTPTLPFSSRRLRSCNKSEKLSNLYFRSNFQTSPTAVTRTVKAKSCVGSQSSTEGVNSRETIAKTGFTELCSKRTDTTSSPFRLTRSNKTKDQLAFYKGNPKNADMVNDDVENKNFQSLNSSETGDSASGANDQLANVILIPSTSGTEFSVVRPDKNGLRLTKVPSLKACEKGIPGDAEQSRNTELLSVLKDKITKKSSVMADSLEERSDKDLHKILKACEKGIPEDEKQSRNTELLSVLKDKITKKSSVMVDSLEERSDKDLHKKTEVDVPKNSDVNRSIERKPFMDSLSKRSRVIPIQQSPKKSINLTSLPGMLPNSSPQPLLKSSHSNLPTPSTVVTAVLKPVTRIAPISSSQVPLVSSSSVPCLGDLKDIDQASDILKPFTQGIKIEINDEEDYDAADSQQFSEEKESAIDTVDSTRAERAVSPSPSEESRTVEEPLSPVIANVMSLAPRDSVGFQNQHADSEEDSSVCSTTITHQTLQLSSDLNNHPNSSSMDFPSPGNSGTGFSLETRQLIRDSIMRDQEKVVTEKKIHEEHKTRLAYKVKELTEEIITKNKKVQQLLKELDILQKELLVLSDSKVRIEASKKAMTDILKELTAKEEAYSKALCEIGMAM